ncbi:hypothetical protein [Rosistilla oblonga]|uniref:hypothetical protein n=1 Tax=Rosistilla oblonga TaxID=2527990 RepID=UPI003A97C2E4
MLVEIGRKAGCLCDLAEQGKLHCPLNVRASSEDVVTGELFGKLQLIDPRWWLPDLLNRSLGTTEYRQQVYRNLEIKLWSTQPPFPAELLPWREGRTEVDVEIRWENPATTIFIEMKLGSDVSRTTSRTNGREPYPSDQLIRNIRVGLHQAGWFRASELFDSCKRRFGLIFVSPNSGHPLVDQYQDRTKLLESIPRSNELIDLPESPIVGASSYRGISQILDKNRRFMPVTERKIAAGLSEYLELKTGQIMKKRQTRKPESRSLNFG